MRGPLKINETGLEKPLPYSIGLLSLAGRAVRAPRDHIRPSSNHFPGKRSYPRWVSRTDKGVERRGGSRSIHGNKRGGGGIGENKGTARVSRSNKSHDRYQPSPFPSTFARRSLSPLVCSFVDRLSRFPHLLYTSVRVNFCAKRTSEVRDASAQRVRDFNPEQPTTELAYHPTNVNLPLRLILLPSYNRVDVFADSFDRSDCCNCIIRRRRLDILPEKFATRAGMLN